MRLLAPATFAEGAWPNACLWSNGVAATAAATVAVFLRKSRRGSAETDGVTLFSINQLAALALVTPIYSTQNSQNAFTVNSAKRLARIHLQFA
jgi:hypothetical protein